MTINYPCWYCGEEAKYVENYILYLHHGRDRHMSIFACSIEHLEFLREVYLKYEQGMYRVEGIDEIPEDAIPSIESTDHFWQVKVKRSKERIEV